MLGRKLLAPAMLVVLLVTATAVQAAPPTEWSVVADFGRNLPGETWVGDVTVNQAPDGTTTISVAVTRIWTCAVGQVVESWSASETTGVLLTVPKNLSTATASSGYIVGGHNLSSTCVGVEDIVNADIGQVMVTASAIGKTERERTADRVRVLTRPAEAMVTLDNLNVMLPAEIVKEIG